MPPDDIVVDLRIVVGEHGRPPAGEIRPARLEQGLFAARLDQPPDATTGRLAIDPGLPRSRETGIGEVERQQKIVLGLEAHAVLLVMKAVDELHEVRCLELDRVERIALGHCLGHGYHVGPGIGMSWREREGAHVAIGVDGTGLGMGEAEPHIVQADRPGIDAETAPLAGVQELAEHVAPLANDGCHLGLEPEIGEGARRRLEIDRAVLGKVGLPQRAARLEEVARVVGGGEADAADPCPAQDLVERRPRCRRPGDPRHRPRSLS